MTTARYDIVVAGAGMSGLVAALTAAENGARVLVLEKGGQAGGSMRLAHGFVGTFDNIETARRLVPDGDELLQETIIEEVEDARQWLSRAGVGFGPYQHAAPDMVSPEFSGRLMEPPQLIACMLRSLTAAGADVRTHSPLHSLQLSGGVVTGATVRFDDRLVDVDTGAVILATGGFQGSPELVQRFIGPNAHHLYLRAQPYSTGDGLAAALAAGGTTSIGMHAFYGHALVSPPARVGQREMLEATQRFGDIAVAVNRNGLRFVDESAGTGEETVNEALAAQPGAEALYIIDDVGAGYDRGFVGGFAGLPAASVILARASDMGARVFTAQSLDQLGKDVAAAGFDETRTVRTLREYNRLIESDPAALWPSRQRFQRALVRPPFSAVVVRAAITMTCGGIAVDPNMAVVDRAKSYSTMPLSMHDNRDFVIDTVPGLFAAGADVGGVHIGGYMGGLATALVTGRIAGAAAPK